MSPTANSARGGAFPTHEPAAHHGAWGGIVLAGLVFAITAVILGLTAEDASVVESIGVAALGAIALVAVITNAVRGASERAGRRYERPLTWLLRSSTDLVMVLDARGRIVYMNPASERLLGRRPDHVLGDELTELVHPEETGAVQALFGDLRGRAGALGKSSLRMVHDDGSTRHFEVAATNMLHDRDVHGIVVNLHDVTQPRAAAQELGRSLLRDPLTGLGNRSMFHERLERAVAARRRDDAHLAVVVVELEHVDRLRTGSDRSGPDHALREIGARLERLVRFEDIVARMGDDQFAVLLERLRGPEEVSVVAERLSAGIREEISVDGSKVAPEAGIGIAISDGEDVAADTLLNDAEVAMYLARQNGTAYEIYAHERDPRVGERMVLATELRQAIPRRDFVLHFQPLVDLRAGRVTAVEALVRWEHRERGILEPAEFVSIAEQTGQIGPLSRLVLELALEAIQSWDSKIPDLSVAVNISPLDLRDRHLPEDVARLAERYGVSAKRLRFEITEGMLFTDPTRAFEVIERLNQLGITFSIDDFGTGYSSLTRLTELPIEELKIDRSFVTEMMRETNKAAIVRSTINLAHELNLLSVAEGVEDRHTLAELGAMGCDVAQGHHIARPMSAERCVKWLSTEGRDLTDLAVSRAEQASETARSPSR
jgi:diguanylate cyclase (GGDEF)-like protein/PAS domain S-box-containing protein